MSFSFEMVLVGMILLSGMALAGIRIWWKRRRELEEIKNAAKSEEVNKN